MPMFRPIWLCSARSQNRPQRITGTQLYSSDCIPCRAACSVVAGGRLLSAPHSQSWGGGAAGAPQGAGCCCSASADNSPPSSPAQPKQKASAGAASPTCPLNLSIERYQRLAYRSTKRRSAYRATRRLLTGLPAVAHTPSAASAASISSSIRGSVTARGRRGRLGRPFQAA
jgi:hypothetical protein